MRFRKHDRGGISFEFVIMFPVLATLLISAFSYFEAFRTNSVMSKIGFTINDIVSRVSEYSNAEMGDMTLLQRKMTPFNVVNQRLRISNICMGPSGLRVYWSQTSAQIGTTPPLELTEATIPVDIMPTLVEGESVMLTEIWGQWTPVVTGFGVGPREFNSELIIRPRFVRMMAHAERRPGNPICPS
ncbi:MAG: hypothetical protein AAF577_00920 [Pseudomonadota bacterium]